jgi:integrase
VFPGDAEDNSLQRIRRFRNDVRINANLPGARHTFAWLMMAGGMSLPIIGKPLGHAQAR